MPSVRSFCHVALALITIYFLYLTQFGYWQGSSAAAQVQVPMFYDAHYLFPRPWTQEQAAPGVPAPAVVSALYGENRVSQSFRVGTPTLDMVEIMLRGRGELLVSLTDGTTTYTGRIKADTIYNSPTGDQFLTQWYPLTFPPFENANQKQFTLTLQPHNLSADFPVMSVLAVGGNQLNGPFLINEYRRPANMVLNTYTKGGWGWLQALKEHFWPDLFQLRLQQYRAEPFKGAIFPLLLTFTAGFTFVFWLWSIPAAYRTLAAEIALTIMLWTASTQAFPLVPINGVELEPAAQPLALAAPPDPGRWQLIDDMNLQWWTTERLPEKYLIRPENNELGMYGKVTAAPNSVWQTSFLVPPSAQLQIGGAKNDPSQKLQLWLGDTPLPPLNEQSSEWRTTIDLTPWAGQTQQLRLQATHPQAELPAGQWPQWNSPQIEVQQSWLTPYTTTTSLVTFSPPAGGGGVELLNATFAQADQNLQLTLFWHAPTPTDAYPTIFIHLLNSAGELVAQRDAPPVQGSYPAANWQPEAVIIDEHLLSLAGLPAGSYQIAIGLYDPPAGPRWSATAADQAVPDGRYFLTKPLEITP